MKQVIHVEMTIDNKIDGQDEMIKEKILKSLLQLEVCWNTMYASRLHINVKSDEDIDGNNSSD